MPLFESKDIHIDHYYSIQHYDDNILYACLHAYGGMHGWRLTFEQEWTGDTKID